MCDDDDGVHVYNIDTILGTIVNIVARVYVIMLLKIKIKSPL